MTSDVPENVFICIFVSPFVPITLPIFMIYISPLPLGFACGLLLFLHASSTKSNI